jgi:hypothetical protein
MILTCKQCERSYWDGDPSELPPNDISYILSPPEQFPFFYKVQDRYGGQIGVCEFCREKSTNQTRAKTDV